MYPMLFLLCASCLIFSLQGIEPPLTETEEQLETVFLKVPDLSDANILSCRVGVRPFRKSGVRLEVEPLSEKLIIHNYGYGGSGLTLSWGGAKIALDLLDQEIAKDPTLATQKAVAVLGAGVIGLTTAYELLEKGYQVNIYADQFSPNLTSDVAAGIWSPPALSPEATKEQKRLYDKLLEISTQRFLACATEPEPEFAGAHFLTCYSFKAAMAHTTEAHLFQEYPAKKKAIKAYFDNGMTKIGEQKEELGLDSQAFMADLYAKVVAKGALLYQRFFSSKDELLALEEQILFNCTSFGSRELFDDQDFHPIRGHMVHFKKPEGFDYLLCQDHVPEANYWMTLYPWSDRLILGGLFEEGEEELQVDQQVIDTLLRNAHNFYSQ